MVILQLESLRRSERARLIDRSRSAGRGVRQRARAILRDVRGRGDTALQEYTERFDGVRREDLRVSAAEIDGARGEIRPELHAALQRARDNIERFHKPQRPNGESYEVEAAPGVRAGQLARPFHRVGLYVPKNLPSTLLMGAVPARLAEVPELIVCTPPGSDGRVPAAVRAAASLVAVDHLYAVGGAQAIAALAYGTESIEAVDKIVGPGNAYVTAAKALVRDEIGIDLTAGPSEVVIMVEPMTALTEETLENWAIAELKAQLEHGPGTSAVLLTSSLALAEGVAAGLDPEATSESELAVLRYADREEALEFVNAYAPEHLGLWMDDAEASLRRVEHAGSVFLGPWTAVALGDYVTGANHILPTAGCARFSSGLGVRDFLQRVYYQSVRPDGIEALAQTAKTIAGAEGMEMHAKSIAARMEEVRS